MKTPTPRFARVAATFLLVAIGAAIPLAIAATVDPNMGFTNPEVGDAGTGYATNLRNSLTTIGAHDHTTGKGIKVPTAGINLNADLEFNVNDATEVRTARFDPTVVTIVASDRRALYHVGGELFYIDDAGLATQITLDGSVKGPVGTITGMTGSATVVYSPATDTYAFTDDNGFPAGMDHGCIRIAREAAGGKGPVICSNPATAADFNFTFPAALPADNRLLCVDAAGNLTTCTATAKAQALVVAGSTSSGSFGTTGAVNAGGAVTSGGAVTAAGAVTGVGGLGITSELGGYTKACLSTLATDTTPVSVGGCSFTGLPAGTYGIHCSVIQNTTLSTAAAHLGLDFTGGSAIRFFCTQFDGSGTPVFQRSTAVSTDDGACTSFSDSSTVSVSSVQGVFTVSAAGAVVLRLRSETTDDVSVENGGICTVARAL